MSVWSAASDRTLLSLWDGLSIINRENGYGEPVFPYDIPPPDVADWKTGLFADMFMAGTGLESCSGSAPSSRLPVTSNDRLIFTMVIYVCLVFIPAFEQSDWRGVTFPPLVVSRGNKGRESEIA